MPVDEKQISKCLRVFKNQDPRLYDQFLHLLALRVEDITVAVTEVPPDQILVAQGRAQEARKMFRLFTELLEDPPEPAQRPGP